jgi:hypothetical protein
MATRSILQLVAAIGVAGGPNLRHFALTHARNVILLPILTHVRIVVRAWDGTTHVLRTVGDALRHVVFTVRDVLTRILRTITCRRQQQQQNNNGDQEDAEMEEEGNQGNQQQNQQEVEMARRLTADEVVWTSMFVAFLMPYWFAVAGMVNDRVAGPLVADRLLAACPQVFPSEVCGYADRNTAVLVSLATGDTLLQLLAAVFNLLRRCTCNLLGRCNNLLGRCNCRCISVVSLLVLGITIAVALFNLDESELMMLGDFDGVPNPFHNRQ